MLENFNLKIDDTFRKIIEIVESGIYWKDSAGRYLGSNQKFLRMFQLENSKQIIGRTDFEIFGLDAGESSLISRNERRALEHGQMESVESRTISGTSKYFSFNRTTLIDAEGKNVGILGSCQSIRESEIRLNEHGRFVGEEKFKQIADQVAHDIRSPISTLLMIVAVCNDIPEKQRVGLRIAANRINDIANNLISQYKKKDAENQAIVKEEREPLLVSTTLLELLTEKKYKYQGQAVDFDHHFSQVGHFSWIHVQPVSFKRMISNVINNAVDAFDGDTGDVFVHLDADDEHVHIAIEDDGKGMTPELVDKITRKIAVSEGKVDGHGIGLAQVHRTVDDNKGQWKIESEVGSGTTMLFSFARIEAPEWIAESVELFDDDTVIVLDDDSSIHLAWSLRFDSLREDYPNLTVLHHEQGQETIDYINGLDPDEKPRVFLLSDYELIRQGLTGLQVIAKTKMDRAILLTSYYGNRDVRDDARTTGTKILPKQMAAEIPIRIDSKRSNKPSCMKKVDAIFIDDEQFLLDTYVLFAVGRLIDTFNNPIEFLKVAQTYEKSIPIMIDQNYAGLEQKGTEIAARLHEIGFENLYLLTGESVIKVPDYLTVLLKSDLDALSDVLQNRRAAAESD